MTNPTPLRTGWSPCHPVTLSPCHPTLHWLRRSIEACGGRGSSAYYSPLRGWAPAYPETTGYLIETLFDSAHHYQEEQWRDLALQCADWLLGLQHPSGAFPGGVGEKGAPLVFDTGMILFGLERSWRETGEERYLEAARRAAHWLLEVRDEQGVWSSHAYQPGYIPAYYSYVVWAVIKTAISLNEREFVDDLQPTIPHLLDLSQPGEYFAHSAFRPGEQATTHTIAYTLRGLLEVAALLNDHSALQTACAIADQLADDYDRKGKIAGRYDVSGKGDYSFVCITGHAQLSVAFLRLSQITGKKHYADLAGNLFSAIKKAPSVIPLSGHHGGIAGSSPLWGAYQPWRYLNWAAKFYVDAVLVL
ncbi:MAG: hypothetical protein JNK77_15445 [Saprospiraceae bacterium]|nr:hypothetical protein [Saprospiraceae bacterium]